MNIWSAPPPPQDLPKSFLMVAIPSHAYNRMQLFLKALCNYVQGTRNKRHVWLFHRFLFLAIFLVGLRGTWDGGMSETVAPLSKSINRQSKGFRCTSKEKAMACRIRSNFGSSNKCESPICRTTFEILTTSQKLEVFPSPFQLLFLVETPSFPPINQVINKRCGETETATSRYCTCTICKIKRSLDLNS